MKIYTLAIIGVLSSVVGAFYYLRIIKVMYFDDLEQPLDKKVGRRIGTVMCVTAMLITLFILSPSHLVDRATAAASVLFKG